MAQAGITLTVLDRTNADLLNIGISMGEKIKMNIEITDDAGGLYRALRAEVCVASNMLSLNHPRAVSELLIIDGLVLSHLNSSTSFDFQSNNCTKYDAVFEAALN